MTDGQRWYREVYLHSDHWKATRERYFREIPKTRCAGCGRKSPLDLHHKTYSRLGREFLSDLEALCRPCHEKKHLPALKAIKKRKKKAKATGCRCMLMSNGFTVYVCGYCRKLKAGVPGNPVRREEDWTDRYLASGQQKPAQAPKPPREPRKERRARERAEMLARRAFYQNL